MKKFILSLGLVSGLIFSFTGCAGNTPKTSKEVSDNVSIKYDKFKKHTEIKTDFIRVYSEFTEAVSIFYRAIIKDKQIINLQIYTYISSSKQNNFNNAVGADGSKFEVIDIDYTPEMVLKTMIHRYELGIGIPRSQLEKMINKDYEIRLYGKSKNYDFVVPKELSKGFSVKLSEYMKK